MSVFGLLTIGAYVLLSLGLYSIAKRRGINRPWLAWIPVARLWLFGCVSDQYRYLVYRQEKSKRKVLLTLSVLLVAVWVIMAIGCVDFVMDTAERIGLWSMSQAELQELFRDDDVAVQQLTKMIMELMRESAKFYTKTMWLVYGLIGGTLFSWGVGIWLTVLLGMAGYDLFRSADPGNASLYLTLSVLGLYLPLGLFVFLCRKKDEGMPPRQEEPPADRPVWEAHLDY